MSSLILQGQAFRTSFLSTFFRLGIEQHRIGKSRVEYALILSICVSWKLFHLESPRDPKQESADTTVSETARTTESLAQFIYVQMHASIGHDPKLASKYKI